MDPLDLAILALRLALVLVLYLFLLSVVRAATRTLRAESTPPARPRAVQKAAGQKVTRLQLVVVEPGSSGLPPGELIEVADGATLGRAGQATVVVADPTVSAQHARVERLDGNP